MLASIDTLSFTARMGAPQHKYHMRLLLTDAVNNVISKTLPACFSMGTGLRVFNGQRRIEQQHPLFGPAVQAAVLGKRNIQITLQLFIHIQ